MVVIATPTRDNVNAGFAFDLIQLVKHSWDVEWAVVKGTYLNNLRMELVNIAVHTKATHILFLDSDMRFPSDTLERLMEHKKDIVGANYRQRTDDNYTSRKGESFITSKDKKGLEEVDSIGFGVTLVDMKVFTSKLRHIPVNSFAMPFDVSVQKFVGEDVYFCTMAKDQGFKVWVDHDLSQEVKHEVNKELGIK